MVRKLPLTKAKSNWVKNRNVTLRGITLSYNAGVQNKYRKALYDLVQQMADETKKQVAKLFNGELANDFFEQQEQAASLDTKSKTTSMDASIASAAKKLMNKLTDKFDKLFAYKSVELATAMVNNSNKTSKTSLHTSFKQLSGGLSLKTGVVPQGMEEITKSLINDNVNLIKSLPQQYLNDVSGAVMRSITTGNGLADLVPELTKYSGISKRRARNIALDQTRKAYNFINRQRMQAIGVKQFEWLHSGGGQHPRQSHIALSGNIFSFDDLPVINQEQVSKGYEAPQRGIPGQAINCRCTMNPVIKFQTDED